MNTILQREAVACCNSLFRTVFLKGKTGPEACTLTQTEAVSVVMV